MPVSSETMKTVASEISLMPRPARWRVPRSRPTPVVSDRCRRHAADMMRSPRTMTAPSCSGVFGSKMFSSSGWESTPSTRVPVAITSLRRVLFSMTISAPTRRRDMCSSARIISSIIRSVLLVCCMRVAESSRLVAPSSSSTRRISCWNSTISSTGPALMIQDRSTWMVRMPITSLSQVASSSTTMPLSVWETRVCRRWTSIS